MTATVSEFLIDRLHAWGVRRIFGYPGDGINGLIAAIDAHQKARRDAGDAGDAIDFVQVRHEEQAAFMACAHAKFTGELGVCLATIYKDVASEYLVTLMSPAGVRHAVDRAVRGALGERTVTALILPKDLQEADAVAEPPHRMN